MGDAPPLEGRKNQKDLTFDVARKLLTSIPTEKMVEPNMVILVAFLVAFGLCGGAPWVTDG